VVGTHTNGGIVKYVMRSSIKNMLVRTMGILVALFYLGPTPPVFAVHDLQFELDGNIADDADTTGQSDWANIFDATGHGAATLPPHFLGTQFVRDYIPGSHGSDLTTFGGGSKDTQNISTDWECGGSNNVSDKADLLNTYATFFVDPTTNHTNLYFGAERFANSGAGNIGIWFLQDPTVGCVAPSGNGTAHFTGDHVDGDLLLVAAFTTGGQVTTINVYRWEGGATGSLNETPILAGADCKTAAAGDQSVCATSNTTAVTPPWPTEDKDGNNVLDASEFLEGGFDLTGLGLSLGCFNKVLVNSRISPSPSADLVDYALGSFVTCNDSNACTVDSCDPAVGCVATPISCDDFNPCTDDSCDPAVGCAHTNNTAACDDGNSCTIGDTCNAGACLPGGTTGCDDGNPCTDDSCDPSGGCVHTNRTGSCEDGNACTIGDTCSDGVCVGGAALHCNDGNSCTDDSCNAASGCVYVNNRASCNDGDACTQTDTCEAGSCVGGNPVVCAAVDGCHDAGTCDPASGVCSNPAKTDGAACDDHDACTQADTCQAGSCIGANPVTCTAVDQCHDAGTCNPADGLCSNPEKANGAVCTDGNACTVTDSCQSGACVSSAAQDGTHCDDGDACTQHDICEAGSCVGTNPVICDAADLCHDAGTCDPATGQCTSPTRPDGTACNDRNACTESDTCQSGTCAGSPVQEGTACDDGNACTASDTCRTGTCVGADPATDGTPCNDGDTCTQTDTCQSGTCVGGDPAADGTACDDGNTCTVGDTCEGGHCEATALPNGTACDDDNGCTATDTCQSSTCLGIAVQDGTTCTDGSACTTTDVCGNGSCRGSEPIVCTALDDCHDAGTCNPATGDCSTPAKADGAACSDGDACTQTDTCQAGTCAGSDPVVCTVLDQCHNAGACDSATGTCSNPPKGDGAACSDGNACTRTDTCQAGTCAGSDPVVCTALDQCHNSGACDPATGTCSDPPKADGTACVDGDACTQTDTCQAGTCAGSNPVVCNPVDQCHDAGTCDPASGSCSSPAKLDGASCEDGNGCTVDDMCVSGVCIGESPSCGDGIMDPSCAEECDDGNHVDRDGCTAFCTLEAPTVCGSAPAPNCRPLAVPGKGALTLRGVLTPKQKKALDWRYAKGALTAKADFGDPRTATSYEVCIYDEDAGTASLVMSAAVPAGGTCGGKPCWKATRAGFRYRNKALTPDGIISLSLKEGKKPGKTRIALKGKNQNLPVPVLPLAQDSTVTVQLKNSEGVCWETRHSAPARKNTATKRPVFKDKAD
jgi:hypothetical protein